MPSPFSCIMGLLEVEGCNYYVKTGSSNRWPAERWEVHDL